MHAKSFSDDFKNHFNGVYGSKYIPRKEKTLIDMDENDTKGQFTKSRSKG